MVKVLVIPVEGPFEVKEVPDDLDAWDALVGGSLCYVSLTGSLTKGIHGYVDDDGDRKYPLNPRATAMFNQFNPGVHDPIYGTMVVAGTDGDKEADFPSALLDLLPIPLFVPVWDCGAGGPHLVCPGCRRLLPDPRLEAPGVICQGVAR